MASIRKEDLFLKNFASQNFAPTERTGAWKLSARGHSFQAPVTPPESPDIDDYTSAPVLESKPVNPDESPLVAVIGVGYVGAHLISSFSAKYTVLGFDVSEDRIREIEKDYFDNERVSFTTRAGDLRSATHFLISVPTLLRPDKSIDASYLQCAMNTIGKYGRPGSTVVFESSVAIGMTRSLLGPLGAAKNFFVGMSPEVGSS